MSKYENQNLAWTHLTPDEKSALTLITVNERSKKEAAIILNKSYYKFSEIYSRARKLFIMFASYYEDYKELIPDGVGLSPEGKLFISLLIKVRKKPSEVSKVHGMEDFAGYSYKDRLWDGLFESLDKNNPHHEAFWEILQEFDRWNSFRILPQRYRKPTAYQRRGNIPYKDAISRALGSTEIFRDMLVQRFRNSQPPFAYLPRVMESSSHFGVDKVALTKPSKEFFSKHKLLLFEDEAKAKKWAELVFDYYFLSKKSPYMSHSFWAKFRLLTAEALNFPEVIGANHPDYLDFSAKDRTFVKSINRPKSKKITIKPTRDGVFWG